MFHASVRRPRCATWIVGLALLSEGGFVSAQETDLTQTPNAIGAGIKKSYVEQIGAGRGDLFTPGSSLFLIGRDPFRSIARGRQLFQRKFTRGQGHGPRFQDGIGDIEVNGALGAGLGDSCANCHARPRGSAGFGGDVFTRPDSRDAPHLFGIGLVEMLADEVTRELREIRDEAIKLAMQSGVEVNVALVSKGISFGSITALPDGSVDTADVEGVNTDLRVRPFFAEGSTISIREFIVGAFNAEMGLQSPDLDTSAAAGGQSVKTPSGMALTGSVDTTEAPPASSVGDDPDGDGVVDEIPTAIVDHVEFYLLNYFTPATYAQSDITESGRQIFSEIQCTSCHVPDLVVQRDRRVANVDTVHDPVHGSFNSLYATASASYGEFDDGSGYPTLKRPVGGPFLVKDIFTDLKRHDLGPNFHERNFDGSMQLEFMTEPLWGVASTPPYGHDGRSINLRDVILRHGGEAQASRDAFAALDERRKILVELFLGTLVLFPPPDTASNLNQANPSDPGYPQTGHGSIDLSVLFNDPSDGE